MAANAANVASDTERTGKHASMDVDSDKGQGDDSEGVPDPAWITVGKGGKRSSSRKKVSCNVVAEAPGNTGAVQKPVDSNDGRRTDLPVLNLNLTRDQPRSDLSGEQTPKEQRSPLTPVGLVSREIQKFDGYTYTDTDPKRLSSQVPNTVEADPNVCPGGPNKVCNETVGDNEDGIQCDKCKVWFHAGCQGVPKMALKAMDRHHPLLLWLCHMCRVWLSAKVDSPVHLVDNKRIQALEEKISNLNPPPSQALEEKISKLHHDIESRMIKLEQAMVKQGTVITDQARLMEKEMKDQASMKTTYADIVRDSCVSMVDTVTKKVEAVQVNKLSNKDAVTINGVFDDFMDKEKRKCNIVAHNLPEQPGDTHTERSAADIALFTGLIREEFSTNIRVLKSFRAGKIVHGKPRLLILTLEHERIKHDILKLAPQLRSSTKWGMVYLNPDLTWKERQANQQLRTELHRRRAAGETDLVILRGKVVSKKRAPGTQAEGSGLPPARTTSAPTSNHDLPVPVTAPATGAVADPKPATDRSAEVRQISDAISASLGNMAAPARNMGANQQSTQSARD